MQGVLPGMLEQTEPGPPVGLMNLARQSRFRSLAAYLWERSGVDESADHAQPDEPDSIDVKQRFLLFLILVVTFLNAFLNVFIIKD